MATKKAPKTSMHQNDADISDRVRANIKLDLAVEELTEILGHGQVGADDLDDVLESFRHVIKGGVDQQQRAVEKLRLLFHHGVSPTDYSLECILLDACDQPRHLLVQFIAREMVKSNPDVHALVESFSHDFQHSVESDKEQVLAILHDAKVVVDKETLDASLPTATKRGGRKPIRL